MFNKVRVGLEEKISSLTPYNNLNDFVSSLLLEYDFSTFPVELNQFLEHRNIKNIQIDRGLSHDALIKIDGNTFHITIRNQYDSQNPKDRYILAHEIAHTFQYEIKSSTLLDHFFFINGSKEQEFFCDFIARAILIPEKSIKSELQSMGGTMKSLKVLNRLIKLYNVEHRELLIRILNDLCLFNNVVIVRFIKFKNSVEWKINEVFMSENIRYDKSFFIPSNDFDIAKKYQDRLPTIRSGKLNSFLDNVNVTLTNKTEIDVSFEDDIFLKTPLRNISNRTMVNLQKGIITKVENNKYPSTNLNLMITLNRN